MIKTEKTIPTLHTIVRDKMNNNKQTLYHFKILIMYQFDFHNRVASPVIFFDEAQSAERPFGGHRSISPPTQTYGTTSSMNFPSSSHTTRDHIFMYNIL